MSIKLDGEHRDTLEQLFSHSRGNVEWRRVLSLLEAVGEVRARGNGKLEVELGGEMEVLEPPRHKDVDEQLLVDLRRMLRRAGFAPNRPR